MDDHVGSRRAQCSPHRSTIDQVVVGPARDEDVAAAERTQSGDDAPPEEAASPGNHQGSGGEIDGRESPCLADEAGRAEPIRVLLPLAGGKASVLH
jgi:hypothetical protein